ncbi:MAG: flagellar hook protein FlgE [Granulosicoccus sp.]
MTFQIALTGINAASTELNSISNNIANNATHGFKKSRVEFSDVYALSAFGASSPSTGSGVRTTNIRQEFAQGDLQFTGRNLDLAVEGLGMFRMEDDGNALYTRAGTFGLDREGYIVNAQGFKLSGFGISQNDEIAPIMEDLRIDFSDMRPNSTENIEFSLNLDIKSGVLPAFDADDPETFNFSTSVTVYDSLGSAQLANFYFKKDAPNTWTAFTYIDGAEVSQVGGDEITFNNDGELLNINGAPAATYTTQLFNPVSGAEPMDVTIDMSDVTQYDNSYGINRVVQDGYAAGRMEDFDIDNDGIVYGRFSNGQAKMMGQVTLTNFPNPAGLRQVGSTSWQENFSSGEPATGAPGTASLGKLQSGALEGSNVDLTKELVAMIGAQRSFQANAQVISTGDTITQTVINIRR